MLRAETARRFLVYSMTIFLCLCNSAAFARKPLIVYTVNYPLQYFAQRIAGEYAKVVLPVPSGIDPAFWQPDAVIVGEIQRADLILLNGAGYAGWIKRVSLPNRKLVNTSETFSKHYIQTEGTVTHSHGREGEHSHAITAYTTWLDFSLAIEQAKAIRDAFTQLMPEKGNFFAANFAHLEQDLLGLDTRMKTIVNQDSAKPLIASHPIYQYLARRYLINLKSVLWEPNVPPSENEWQNLAEMRKKHRADWLIWEDDPIPDTQKRLIELGIQSTVFNPCGNRPEYGDFLSTMLKNLDNMSQVYGHKFDN